MKYTLSFILMIFVLAGATAPAKASSFYECDVQAAVKPSAEHEGKYDIHIKKSLITDGMGSVGTPCFSMLTFTKTAEIEGENIPHNEMITLKFRSYSGMGDKGPVSSETWVYEGNKEENSDE